MNSKQTLIQTAVNISYAVNAGFPPKVDNEILLVDSETVAIVIDIDGVDYILTMMRVPMQRPRPTSN